MTTLSADERLANAIWRVISNPARIFTKRQIHDALAADGIYRSFSTLFGNYTIRRILENKADARGLALVIDQGCVFVTTEEWQILHRQVRQLRYMATLGESIGHRGRGNDILLAAADPVSQEMGAQAIAAGVFGRNLRRELENANAVLAATFEDGRAAANAAFSERRARANARA